MQIEISGHQIDVTPALHDYVMNKLQRLERHFDSLLAVHVILSVEKLEQRAEATITASGRTLHADSVAENMYAAIDLLADKLDRQVLKHKEKLTDHHRGESAARQSSFG
jgi:putative sigma-54 modulation protein